MTPTTITKAAAERRARLPFSLDLRDPATVVPRGWQRLVAIVVGLAASAIYLSRQPNVGGTLGQTAWDATGGTALGISQVLLIATALLVAGCSAAIAQRVGMWNLGIQGQLIFGAWLATLVAYTVPGLPGPLLIPLLLLAGFVGGAAWILVPALARSYLRVDEIITTLMLNFVALLWLAYWATGPWANVDQSTGTSGGALFSRQIASNAFLPQFRVGDVNVGLAFPLALLLALLLWAGLRWSHYGLRTRLTGAGDDTGRYAGIRTNATRISVLLLSGGVAGLGGALIELDQVHSFSTPITANDPGYIGIVVALLAANSFLFVVPTALLLAAIVVVGTSLQIAGVSSSVVFLMTGLLLLFAACSNVVGRIDVHRTRIPSEPRGEPS